MPRATSSPTCSTLIFRRCLVPCLLSASLPLLAVGDEAPRPEPAQAAPEAPLAAVNQALVNNILVMFQTSAQILEDARGLPRNGDATSRALEQAIQDSAQAREAFVGFRLEAGAEAQQLELLIRVIEAHGHALEQLRVAMDARLAALAAAGGVQNEGGVNQPQ